MGDRGGGGILSNTGSDPGNGATGDCWCWRLGVVPYRRAWRYQQHLVTARKGDPTLVDALLLLQHPPTYTLGTGSDDRFVKFNPSQSDLDLVRIERGGEVTYHAPGQLVGYPILNLRRHRPDLHWYLRSLEEVIIDAIAAFGVRGERLEGLTGVWVEGRKVAAIGIKVSRWISMHGFALNICPDLDGFKQIVPCGIGNRPVGSLREFVPDVEFEAVREAVEVAFCARFGLRLVAPPNGAIADAAPMDIGGSGGGDALTLP